MKEYALVIDYKYCTGCHSCEIACRKEKGMPLDDWGIKITEIGPEKLDGKWIWNYLPVISDLCDGCVDRVKAGQKPACAHNCLAACMEAVPVEQVSAKLAEIGGGVVCYAIQ